MPAKDLFHDIVRMALIRDGWTITHDPLVLRYHKRDVFIDLGAEQLIAAEKELTKIAVEVKSFAAASPLAAFEQAVGHYIVYQDVIEEMDADRSLYLAVPDFAGNGILSEPIGEVLIERHGIQIIVFDPDSGEVLSWNQ